MGNEERLGRGNFLEVFYILVEVWVYIGVYIYQNRSNYNTEKYILLYKS